MNNKVLHYELPYGIGRITVRAFCGKTVRNFELAYNQEEITCEKCKEELKKYNKSGENV